MRYRLSALMLLMLLALLPVMNVLAAPVPAPSAVLDIGPPPEGETPEQHRKREIDYLTLPDNLMARAAWHDPRVRRLPSVAALEPPRVFSWFSNNLRVTPEGKGNRFRLTFRAGNRDEQVAVLNSVLRAYIRQVKDERLHFHEKNLRWEKDRILELEKRIESRQHGDSVDTYRKEIDELRSLRIPECRAEIARYKQIAVIKWAK